MLIITMPPRARITPRGPAVAQPRHVPLRPGAFRYPAFPLGCFAGGRRTARERNRGKQKNCQYEYQHPDSKNHTHKTYDPGEKRLLLLFLLTFMFSVGQKQESSRLETIFFDTKGKRQLCAIQKCFMEEEKYLLRNQ